MKQIIYNKLEKHKLAAWLVFTAMRLESIAESNIMKPMGLSASSFRILVALQNLGPQTPSELIETLGSSKSNLTQRLSWLEKKSLVSLKRNKKGDRRKVSVKLTIAGKKKLATTAKLIKEKNLEIEKYFNKNEAQLLLKLLRHINTCLDNKQINVNKTYEKK